MSADYANMVETKQMVQTADPGFYKHKSQEKIEVQAWHSERINKSPERARTQNIIESKSANIE